MRVIVTLVIVFVILFVNNQALAQSSQPLQTKILNPDAHRELELRLNVEATRFVPTTKEVSFNTHFAINDQKSTDPFQSWLRVYPYAGPFDFNETMNKSGYYQTVADLKYSDNPTRSTFPINLWPYEQYVTDIFLQFDHNVRIKQFFSPIDTFQHGELTDSIDWTVKTESYESSMDEMKKRLPSTNYQADIEGTVVKFEVIISSNTISLIKNGFYAALTLIPVALIIGHIKYVKEKKLSVQVTLFTSISILLITSLFTIRQFLPHEITAIELVIGGFVIYYTYWFFKKLRSKKNDENYSQEHKIYR